MARGYATRSGLMWWCLLFWVGGSGAAGRQPSQYSAHDDASWAIRKQRVTALLDPAKQSRYYQYLRGCSEWLGLDCAVEDRERLKRNRQQPPNVSNFTRTGHIKIRAPEELFRPIQEFFAIHRDHEVPELEEPNTYHNSWESPTTLLPLDLETNAEFQEKIRRLGQWVLQEWSGQELSPVALYGIRLYHNNSILAPHVDRFPLIVSAIINVDQSLEEDWPLEVYGHDGKATNVTMVPGDMVLYESHSVVHGRPFPMKGDYYANLFLHFEPVGPLNPDEKYDIPPYLIPGSLWAREWKKQFPDGWRKRFLDGRTAAVRGDAAAIRRIAKHQPTALEEVDANGWLPLHEAVRAGHLEAIEVILDAAPQQANLRTRSGATAFDIARQFLGENHAATRFLLRHGRSQNEL